MVTLHPMQEAFRENHALRCGLHPRYGNERSVSSTATETNWTRKQCGTNLKAISPMYGLPQYRRRSLPRIRI